MRKTDISLLEKLSSAFGPSGCEKAVADLIEKEIRPFCDSVYYDRSGNLIAVIKAKNAEENVLFSAHMDEIGFMIKSVDEEGRFSVVKLGNIDTTPFCGRHVLIGNEEKVSEAVFSSRAIHTQSRDDRDRPFPWDKVYVEAGAENAENAEKSAEPGNFGTFACRNFGKLGHYLKGKALDGRSGCAILCQMIKAIREEKISPKRNLYFCFTVKSELSVPGAQNAAFAIRAREAYVITSVLAADLPEVPAHLVCTKLGKGAVLSTADMRTIYAKELLQKAIKCAEDNGIPYQMKQVIEGGNDASFVQKSGAGTKVLAIAVPCRYAHTASCVISEKDYESVLALAMQLI